MLNLLYAEIDYKISIWLIEYCLFIRNLIIDFIETSLLNDIKGIECNFALQSVKKIEHEFI